MMRRGLWLATGALLLAVVVSGGAVPANAASSDWDEAWDAPPAAVYNADPTLTSTFLYKSCSTDLCTIDQISGTIVGGPTTNGCTLPDVGSVVYGSSDPSAWQTSRSVTDTPHFTCNGTYTITRAAHAVSPHRVCSDFNPCDLGWSDDLTVTFDVAIPPAAPTGVTATGEGGKVTVAWQPLASPDPDFVGYRVSRVDAAGHRLPVADKFTTGTSFVDADVPSGDYTYVVHALRDGPNGEVVASADASSTGVTVVAPPPTTPTTDASSSSNAGGGGGGVVVHSKGGSRTWGSASKPTSGTTQDPSIVGDEGFSSDLPYEAEPGEVEARPSIRTHDPKPGAGILVPTAVASVLFVWAMHILYVTRQARLSNAGLLPIEVEPAGAAPPPGAADDDWLAMAVAGSSTGRRGGYDDYRFDADD